MFGLNEKLQTHLNNTNAPSVDPERLGAHLSELAKFGAVPGCGINRSFGSKADLTARGWLRNLWGSMELAVETDSAANLWATLEGAQNLPAIAIGSHHDTVRNGGAYDGAAGVLLATEAVKRIREEKIVLRHPLRIVSFTAEEPNSFGISTMGSKIASGKLTSAEVSKACDRESGQFLTQALTMAGGKPEKLSEAIINPEKVSAFLECHIEQGRVLDDQSLPVGVVEKITGIYRETVRIIGDANHSGTTLFRNRHDALLAASEFMLGLEKTAKTVSEDQLVATVGHIEVQPNSTNIIPGDVRLTMEIRTPDSGLLQQVLHKLETVVRSVEENRGVEITRRTLLNQQSVLMDPSVRAAVRKAAGKLSLECPALVSMAGHDAAHIAGVTRAGMLFVRTVGGHSHCPKETVELADLKKAGDVLLEAVLILDKELD